MVLMSEILTALVQSICLKDSGRCYLPEAWRSEDWFVFLELARFHGLTPLLAHNAECGRLKNIPVQQLEILQKDLHKNRLFHKAASARLKEIEAAFKSAGIPATPLKGPRLSEDIYPGIGLRPFEDLDILIEPADIKKASDALRPLGYRPVSEGFGEKLLTYYHFHSQWFHPLSMQCVELHWRAADKRTLPPGVDEKNRTHRKEIENHPEAYAVYLAVHLAKHGIVSDLIVDHELNPLLVTHPLCDVRLIWLLDFALIMSSKQIDPSTLMKVANDWQVSGAVTNAIYLSKLVTGTSVSDKPTDLSSKQLPPNWKSRLIKRVAAELQQPAQLFETPWWLKPGKRTGFRPIRILDLFTGKQ